MQGFKLILSLLFLCFFTLNTQAQQQSSKSKSADKLYEKGELNRNIILKNAAPINTDNLEFSPVFYNNGLVFVSAYNKGLRDKKGETFLELFYSELDANGLPLKREDFSVNLNSTKHEGPVSFNKTAEVIYFTRNNSKNGVTKSSDDGVSRLKIYEAKRGALDWENVKELSFNNATFDCMHPSLSADGQTLYFTSNMPGGFGGTDIYMVQKQGDKWGQPINLGEEVNTSEKEGFPYIHESGTLFFSSNGHGGYGGYDMYMYEKTSRGGTALKNLGVPFNSGKDDLGFIINEAGTRGYFASDRTGGYGKDDIYLFEAEETLVEEAATPISARINIYDEATKKPIEGSSIRVFERAEDGFIEGNELYDIQLLPVGDDGELVMKLVRKNAESLGEAKLLTNSEGEAISQMSSNKNYIILATKQGYDYGEIMYSTKGVEGAQNISIPLKTKSCANVTGVIMSEKFDTRVPNAIVRIVNETTGKEEFHRTNADGEFSVCLPLGSEYAIHVEKDGFTRGVSKISTVGKTTTQKVDVNVKITPITENIINEPIREGSVIVLENIYYDFNKSAIRKGAARELDGLVELMKLYPSMEIEMVAHTDARGTENYNLDLSLKRAESAREYIVRTGISEDRIKAFGYGESQLRNSCFDGTNCTDEEHQFNRRTEVKVTRINEPVKVQYQEGNPFEGGGKSDGGGKM
mgnify:CR=1 FL=1